MVEMGCGVVFGTSELRETWKRGNALAQWRWWNFTFDLDFLGRENC